MIGFMITSFEAFHQDNQFSSCLKTSSVCVLLPPGLIKTLVIFTCESRLLSKLQLYLTRSSTMAIRSPKGNVISETEDKERWFIKPAPLRRWGSDKNKKLHQGVTDSAWRVHAALHFMHAHIWSIQLTLSQIKSKDVCNLFTGCVHVQCAGVTHPLPFSHMIKGVGYWSTNTSPFLVASIVKKSFN